MDVVPVRRHRLPCLAIIIAREWMKSGRRRGRSSGFSGTGKFMANGGAFLSGNEVEPFQIISKLPYSSHHPLFGHEDDEDYAVVMMDTLTDTWTVRETIVHHQNGLPVILTRPCRRKSSWAMNEERPSSSQVQHSCGRPSRATAFDLGNNHYHRI